MRHTTNEIWFAEQRDLAMAERDGWQARAERAEARVAELEAQLAAAQSDESDESEAWARIWSERIDDIRWSI